jgi:hypothetical protein
MSESFHVKFSWSGFIVLKNKIFKWPHLIFTITSPLKRTCPLFEQTSIPFTKWYVPSLIDFGLQVLEKKIFKNVQCIFTHLLLPTLGEGQSASIEQTWIRFPHGWFVPSLVKIGPVVLEKIFKRPQTIFTCLSPPPPLWRGPVHLF